MTTAIVVACLASYRALFIRNDRPQKLPNFERNKSSSHKTSLKGLLAFMDRKSTLDPESMEGRPTTYNVEITGQEGSNRAGDPYNAGNDSESLDHILPLDAVHVRSDITNTFSTLEREGTHRMRDLKR